MKVSELEFGPILRAMKHRKIGAVLIAVQIAVTMTVIVNAFFLVQDHVQKSGRPSGIVEGEIFHLANQGFGSEFNERATLEEDLAMLRQTPGIVDAIQINAIPLTGSGWSMNLTTEPGDDIEGTNVAVYMVDTHGINTLGVELIAGENFAEVDVRWRDDLTGWPAKTIITKSTAEAMFPDEPFSAIGKTVYIGSDDPMTIVGIIQTLQTPWVGWKNVEDSILVPERTLLGHSRYMVRAAPGQRDALMPLIEDQLARSNSQRLIHYMYSMEETREQGYLEQAAVATVLGIVMVVLTLITSLGIMGLASFSVNRRTKEIGTRRALGATRRDILRHFLLENFLITAMGVVLGGVMTITFNIWLGESMGFPKIDWVAVPIGMLALSIIGLLSVYGPALRACAVPPAVATRTI
jgi:putative ABC transport system permease protein